MTILIRIVNRRLRAAICFKTGFVSGGSSEAVVDLLMECPFAQVRKSGEAQIWIYGDEITHNATLNFHPVFIPLISF